MEKNRVKKQLNNNKIINQLNTAKSFLPVITINISGLTCQTKCIG